ncbi:DUF6894 family protein [Qipengyuania atrilutea]|uniref:DUF6894 domain-containing protein n=1 Tax=Qipengyuania atrilutea TaxID=2744473 RepID=A0A850GVJ2_9SPHN|nr:hypothetical protein [Actirhodobacter atriluteus]NVD43511.1 hypothetical protein [Actirhodobacter atriluteus]
MAIFFFHLIDGDLMDRDETGLELPSVEHAYLEARAGCEALWFELLHAGRDPRRCRFSIEDAAGRELLDLPFTELFDRCPPASVRSLRFDAAICDQLGETHRRAARARTDLHSEISAARRSLEEARLLLRQLDSRRNKEAY